MRNEPNVTIETLGKTETIPVTWDNMAALVECSDRVKGLLHLLAIAAITKEITLVDCKMNTAPLDEAAKGILELSRSLGEELGNVIDFAFNDPKI